MDPISIKHSNIPSITVKRPGSATERSLRGSHDKTQPREPGERVTRYKYGRGRFARRYLLPAAQTGFFLIYAYFGTSLMEIPRALATPSP